VYVLNCDLTMNNGQLHGNEADVDGGGFYVDAANKTAVLSGVRVTQNYAGRKGGGGYIMNGTLAGSLAELTGNEAGVAIPGIARKAGQTTVTLTVPPGEQTIQDD
jgi:hypothetical protein